MRGRFRLTERELPIVYELHRFIHKCCLATLILKIGVKTEVSINKLFVIHKKTQNHDELKKVFTISSVEETGGTTSCVYAKKSVEGD